MPVACQVANDAKMLYATFNPMPCPNSTVHDAMLDKAKAGVLLADTRAEHRSLLVRACCEVAHTSQLLPSTISVRMMPPAILL